MRILPITLAGLLLTGTALAQTPGSLTRTITAGALNAALANKADVATTVSQTTLPSTAFRANFDDAPRALTDRMSDHLNVKAFGAKGDGVTDDTLAFQNAAAVATGHVPTGIGAALSFYLERNPISLAHSRRR